MNLTILYSAKVLAPAGLILRDSAGAESEGAKKIMTVKCGHRLDCVGVQEKNGVPYAEVISPVNPTKTLFARIAEANANTIYLELTAVGGGSSVLPSGGGMDVVISLLTRIAVALEKIAGSK